ncbi:unnamed protein product [Urochloa humidicola]
MPALTAGRHSALLRRCAAGGDLSLARSSTHHAQALVGGRLPDATLDTDRLLVDCCCGALHRARQMFDGMPSPLHARLLLSAFGLRSKETSSFHAMSSLQIHFLDHVLFHADRAQFVQNENSTELKGIISAD